MSRAPISLNSEEFRQILTDIPVGSSWRGYLVAGKVDNTPRPNGYGGDWAQGYEESVSVVLRQGGTYWRFDGTRDSYGEIHAAFVGREVTAKEKQVTVYDFE